MILVPVARDWECPIDMKSATWLPLTGSALGQKTLSLESCYTEVEQRMPLLASSVWVPSMAKERFHTACCSLPCSRGLAPG